MKNKFATLSQDVIDASQSKNEMVSETVHLYFRDHYINLENGDNGAKMLLLAILDETKMPRGVETTNQRGIAIGNALFFAEITDEVRAAFGFFRYPNMSIRSFLLLARHLGKQVVSIQLTNEEDADRPETFKKPRAKYYLAD